MPAINDRLAAPEGSELVQTAVRRQVPPSPPDPEPSMNPMLCCPLPLVQTASSDSLRQFYRQGTSQTRLISLSTPIINTSSSPSATSTTKAAATAATYSETVVTNITSTNAPLTSTAVVSWNGDTSFSRISEGVVALGNGMTGDASGTLEADVFNAGTGFKLNGRALAAFVSSPTSLTAAQIQNLSSSPVTLVPAAGLNTVIVPSLVVVDYTTGTNPFQGANQLQIGWNGKYKDLLAVAGFLDQVQSNLATAFAAVFGDKSVIANQPLVLTANSDLIAGPVSSAIIVASGATDGVHTITINTGGSAYQVGDVLSINGPSSAILRVDSVDGLGAVLTATLTQSGTGYVLMNNVATTPITSTGIGLTVDITSLGDLFQVGDTLQPTNTNAVLTVSAVNANGTLASLGVTTPGDNVFPVLHTLAILSGSGGSAVTPSANLTVTPGDGTAMVTTYYTVLHV